MSTETAAHARLSPAERRAAAGLLAEALPGARLLHVRRLRGGISARVHLIEYERHSIRARGVLRRARHARPDAPATALREWRTLKVLAAAGAPAPRPLLVDAEGAHFGVPAMLTDYCGSPLVRPRDPAGWLRQMAAGIAAVHAITPSTHELSFLERFTDADMADRLERGLAPPLAADHLAQEAQALLGAAHGAISWSRSLVHNDYWSGNTVWRRGRLGAIVDWGEAGIGDPRRDIAECRISLVLMYGPETAAAFTDAYASARPAGTLTSLWFFDLFRGLHALAEYREWLPGIRDLGLTEVSDAAQGTRLRSFLRAAIREGRRALRTHA